ncbi:MAG: hypothetical protein HYS18_04035 [Burkholderiales bacterium]|nr:hypothetical protein [Burkholderiales bacterium]
MKASRKYLAVLHAACAAAFAAQGAIAAEPAEAQKQADKKLEKKSKPGEINGFNPQPEPPGDKSGKRNPGAAQGFNPQPDPPGIGGKANQQIKQ